MRAGENTLNAVCARLTTRSITSEKSYSSSRFLKDYVEFMTTPGSHNDTYAESFHRDFFSNWAAGVPPEKCAGKEGHNTPTIGGFVMLPPVVCASLWRGEALMKRAVVEHLQLTHDSELLASRAELFAGLLGELIRGVPAQEALQSAGKQLSMDLPSLVKRAAGDDGAVVGRMFSTACYITDSFPSVLYLASAHADSFEDAVLSNTNLGGENCHRGSALGAIMGAALGESRIPPRFITGLADSQAIAAEIDAFMAVVAPQVARI
jgi:ADP-ribosylglycohydrolase